MSRVSAVVFMVPGLALASPVSVVHQGRLLDSMGAPVDGTVSVEISLLNTAGGAATFTRTETVAAVGGYYSVRIHQDNASQPLDSAVFEAADWIRITAGGVTSEQFIGHAPKAAVAASVVGSVRVTGDNELVLGQDNGTTCSNEGALVYDPDQDAVKVCVGNSWQSVGSTGGLRFDAATGGLQYQDGALWRPVPPIALNPRAFRHYRINVTETNGGAFATGDMTMLELVLEWNNTFQPNAMTSCTTGTIGGLAAVITPSDPAANCAPGGSWMPWMAFNGTGLHGNGWLTYTLPSYLDIDLGTRVQVTRYQVQAGTCTASAAPRAWTFEGSDDGITWTVLHSVTGQTGWPGSINDCSGVGQVRTFTLP
jgi:hypothetical protein